MGYGGPIGLIVIGLILTLALREEAIGPLDIWMLGAILVGAGLVWLLLTIVQANSRRTATTSEVTTDSSGNQARTERTTDM